MALCGLVTDRDHNTFGCWTPLPISPVRRIASASYCDGTLYHAEAGALRRTWGNWYGRRPPLGPRDVVNGGGLARNSLVGVPGEFVEALPYIAGVPAGDGAGRPCPHRSPERVNGFELKYRDQGPTLKLAASQWDGNSLDRGRAVVLASGAPATLVGILLWSTGPHMAGVEASMMRHAATASLRTWSQFGHRQAASQMSGEMDISPTERAAGRLTPLSSFCRSRSAFGMAPSLTFRSGSWIASHSPRHD